MQIKINDELFFDLTNRRDKKDFLNYQNALVETNAFDDLLHICKKLNEILLSTTNVIQINYLAGLQSDIISALEKIVRIQPQKKLASLQAKTSTIGISFRHDEGKRMHGAFFDHYVFRKITHRRTHLITSQNTDLQKLSEFIEQFVFTLSLSGDGKKNIPTRYEDTNRDGLIVIPGYSRELLDKNRLAFENHLIQKARLMGQPVLAICAGSWTLWSAYGGRTKNVEDHVYSSMPYIVNDGGVGNNKQIHQVDLKPHTIVHGALMFSGLTTRPTVNSIHWMAPNPDSLPALLEITATSKRSEHIEVSNRQSEVMVPEENTVEAFETKYGAPMMGVQWHPECYFSHQNKALEQQRHLNLIKYMVLAGDAYQAKRKMLKEMKTTQQLEKISFFKTLNALHELKTLEIDYRLGIKNQI